MLVGLTKTSPHLDLMDQRVANLTGACGIFQASYDILRSLLRLIPIFKTLCRLSSILLRGKRPRYLRQPGIRKTITGCIYSGGMQP